MSTLSERVKVKYCWKCGFSKPESFFGSHKSQKDGLARHCMECGRMMKKGVKRGRPSSASARTMKHRERYKEKYDKYRNDKRVETKAELVDGYGGKCTCCGESTLEFLTLEHLEKDGKKHRADRHNSQGTYKDVISMGFPDNYTVLCLNCNHARRYGKECPHKEKGDMGKRSVTINRLVEALDNSMNTVEAMLTGFRSVNAENCIRESAALLAELSAHNGGEG